MVVTQYGFKVISGDITECIDKAILFLIKAYKKHYNEEFEATYNFSKILKEKDGEIEFLKNKIKDLESGKKKRGRPKGTRIIKGFLEPKNTDFFEGDIKSLIDYLGSQGLIQGKEDIIKGSIGKGEQTSKFSEAAIEREILRGNPDISGVPHLFFIYNNDKQEFIKLRAKAYRRLWNKHNKNNNGNK